MVSPLPAPSPSTQDALISQGMAHKVPKVVVTVLEVIIQVFRWAGKLDSSISSLLALPLSSAQLGSGLSDSLRAFPLPSALRSLAEAPTPW